jgi:Tfp pilus assembly protein PilF
MWGVLAASGLLAGCASLPSRPAPKAVSKTERREATLACARLCERHNDANQARRIYEALIKENPKQVEPYHRLAVLAAKEGNFAEADAYFQKALAAGPATAELLSDMGYALYLQDRLSEAEKALRRAVEVDPNYLAAHNNLGLVLGQQGKLEAAMAAFRKAGSEAQAHANLAYVHATRGELDQAERHYSRALTLDQELRPAAEALLQVARHTGSLGRPLNLTPARQAAADDEDDMADASPSTRSPNRPARATAAVPARRKPAPNDLASEPEPVSAAMPTAARRPADNLGMPTAVHPAAAQTDSQDMAHVGITPPKHREPFSWRSQPATTQEQAGTLVLQPNLTPELVPQDQPNVADATRPAPRRTTEPKQPQLAQRHAPRRPVVKIVAHESAGEAGQPNQQAVSADAAASSTAVDADAASAVWVSDEAEEQASPPRRANSAVRQRSTRTPGEPRPTRRGMIGRLLLGDDEAESQSGFATASDAPQDN